MTHQCTACIVETQASYTVKDNENKQHSKHIAIFSFTKYFNHPNYFLEESEKLRISLDLLQLNLGSLVIHCNINYFV